MKVLFVLWLVSSTIAQTYLFNDANITLTPLSQGRINATSSFWEECGAISVGKLWIYHLSSKNVFQRWTLGNLTAADFNLSFTTAQRQSITGFGVDPAEQNLAFPTNTTKMTYIYLQDQKSITLNKNLSNSVSPSGVFIQGTRLVEFYNSISPAKQPTLVVRNLTDSTVLAQVSTQKSYDFASVSPNMSYIVIWTQYTQCIFYNTTNLTSVGTYKPPSAFFSGLTGNIVFSADQTLAIIQTDNINPLVVISMANFSVVYQISIFDTIDSAFFLNQSNTFLVLINTFNTIYVNLRTGTLYTVPFPLFAPSVYTFSQNSFYSCQNNVINRASVSIVSTVKNATNSTSKNQTKTNTTSQNSTTPINQTKQNTSNSTNGSSLPSNGSSSLPASNSSSLPANNSNTPSNAASNDTKPLNLPNNTIPNNTQPNVNPNGNSSQTNSNSSQPNLPTPPAAQNQSSTSNQNESTPQATPASDPNTPSNGLSSDEESFYVKDLANFSQVQSKIMSAIQSSLQKTSSLAYNSANIASSTPIAIYFLACLNFISTSSLYVLLNFPLPQQIYKYFSMLYSNLSSSILTSIGINIDVVQYSDEKVDRKKPQFFGISSDILQANEINLLLFPLNLIVILAVRYLVLCFFGKQNFVSQLLGRNMKNMIFGQIICLVQSIVLPWAFVVIKGGVRNIKTKLNLIFYIVLFLLSVLIPFYYFLEMIFDKKILDHLRKVKEEKSSKKEKAMKAMERFHSQFFLEYVTTTKVTFYPGAQKKQPPQKHLTTNRILTDWYLCQTNLIFPLLVLLQSPVIFLIIIMLHNILGMVIAFNGKRRRVNNTLLSLYPIIFHICFGVFYWSADVNVISMFEIVCLVAFLAGSIHYAFTFLFDLVFFILHFLRQTFCTRKIKPEQVPDFQPLKVKIFNRPVTTHQRNHFETLKSLDDRQNRKSFDVKSEQKSSKHDQVSTMRIQTRGQTMLKKIKLKKAREIRKNFYTKVTKHFLS